MAVPSACSPTHSVAGLGPASVTTPSDFHANRGSDRVSQVDTGAEVPHQLTLDVKMRPSSALTYSRRCSRASLGALLGEQPGELAFVHRSTRRRLRSIDTRRPQWLLPDPSLSMMHERSARSQCVGFPTVGSPYALLRPPRPRAVAESAGAPGATDPVACGARRAHAGVTSGVSTTWGLPAVQGQIVGVRSSSSGAT